MDRSGGAYQGLVSGKGLFFDATPSDALSRMSPFRKRDGLQNRSDTTQTTNKICLEEENYGSILDHSNSHDSNDCRLPCDKEDFVGMFVGIFSGCIILAGGNPLTGLGMSFDKLIGVVSSAWNVKLILFATLIGGMIKLMQVSGAVSGLIQWLQKKAKITTPAKAQF